MDNQTTVNRNKTRSVCKSALFKTLFIIIIELTAVITSIFIGIKIGNYNVSNPISTTDNNSSPLITNRFPSLIPSLPAFTNSNQSLASEVLFFPDKIQIPKKGINLPDYFTIDKTNYPSLFNNEGLGISLTEYRLKDNTLLFINQELFEAASYHPTTFLIFDQNAQNIIYKSQGKFNKMSGYFFDPISQVLSLSIGDKYYSYSTCVACGLPVLEYLKYNSSTQNFVLVNSQYSKDFIKILDEWNRISNEECYYNNVKSQISDLIQKYGTNIRCQDSVAIGSSEFKSNPSFLTLGQFTTLKTKIEQIIAGKNISLLQ